MGRILMITYTGLIDLVEQGVISNVPLANINGASIDVRLGESMLRESDRGRYTNIARGEKPKMESVRLNEDGTFMVYPNEFLLGHTMEVFNLPDDISAQFLLKSSVARSGIDHALATWADPGWNGSVLTLELKNNLRNHILLLEPGMKIGQMIFWQGETVPTDASYRTVGQYNGDLSVIESRGVK
jgi:dCTP deaminase